MTPHPSRPGIGSTVIDIFLVAVILGTLFFLVLVAFRVLAGIVRAVTRPRRWPGRRRQ